MYVELLIEELTVYCILNRMKKIFKLFIASLLTATLGVATVLCCCIAPSVMAQFHKKVVCSHCQGQNPKSNSSNPAAACQQQLTSADISHAQTISSPVVSADHFPSAAIFNNHHIALTHSLLLAYPPGGPPLGISFTPLYLRTFNLRV
jgi:hypothetical protein